MWAQQWALLEEVSLQINDWFIFIVYTLFSVMMIVVLPLVIVDFKKGIKIFKQYRFQKLPLEVQRSLKFKSYDTGYAIEPLLGGLFGGVLHLVPLY